MKKLILLALVCTGFAVTTPFTAHALDSEKIAQYDSDQNRDWDVNNQVSCHIVEGQLSKALANLTTVLEASSSSVESLLSL